MDVSEMACMEGLLGKLASKSPSPPAVAAEEVGLVDKLLTLWPIANLFPGKPLPPACCMLHAPRVDSHSDGHSGVVSHEVAKEAGGVAFFWFLGFLGAVLDVLRLLVLHPQAASALTQATRSRGHPSPPPPLPLSLSPCKVII